jgi:hypothetical protein
MGLVLPLKDSQLNTSSKTRKIISTKRLMRGRGRSKRGKISRTIAGMITETADIHEEPSCEERGRIF